MQVEHVEGVRIEVQSARAEVQAAEAKFRPREGENADVPEAVGRELIPLQPKATEQAQPPSEIPPVQDAPEN